MADLDDFFAKKDKKKSKTKKFLTQEELREKLEDNSKKAVVEPVKAKTFQEENGSGVTATAEAANTKDDEEWKEVQEEKKDYSNLKIGQLSLNENNHFVNDSDNDGEDGESGYDKNSGVDPWKKVGVESGVVIAVQEPSRPVASKLYISPALRAAANAPMRPSKLRSSVAPDISNEDFFPTLANARPEEQRKKKNEPAFEEVRHGGRVQHIKPNAQQLKSDEVVNRFRSLEETDS